MSDEFDEKLARFERLWDGVTPKGQNRIKALKFRQYMRNHVMQKFHKRRKDQWANADKGRALVKALAPRLSNRTASCHAGCHKALDTALITAPDARDPAMMARLEAVAGRVLGDG